MRKLSCELDRLLGEDCSNLILSKFEQHYNLEFSNEGKKRFLVMYSEKAEEIEAMTT